MSANLRRLAFSQGSKKDLNIEQKLMERMRDVTVSMLHTAVHTVALYEARQSPGESTKAFAAKGAWHNIKLQHSETLNATRQFFLG